jgi:hypothetical protein
VNGSVCLLTNLDTKLGLDKLNVLLGLRRQVGPCSQSLGGALPALKLNVLGRTFLELIDILDLVELQYHRNLQNLDRQGR